MSTVVTGSASGIGAAVRKRFEHDGDTVIGIDIRDAEIIADLSTREGREAAIAGVKRRGLTIDRFVACAGLATDTRPPSLIASVNYFGTVDLLDGLFEELQQGSSPCAVLVLSNSMQWLQLDGSPFMQALLQHDEHGAAEIVDQMPDAFFAASLAYVGSKLALGRAVRKRASVWGKAGVRLNGIAPGNTKTPMLQRILEDPNTRDGVANMEIPLGRLADPAEIAGLVAFLCGAESSYIHGSIIYIDGGIDATVCPDSI
ncbi:MAG: SDR family oxidoreductase [Dehalococcoidia bacterium]|nr:SDR family oxidoreductase [Dehalococcoidia bacterium]